MKRILLAAAVLGLIPALLCAKTGKKRREAKEGAAEGVAKTAELNRGQLFYNWMRTSADDLPEAVSSSAHESLAHRKVKALTGGGFAAYVSVDDGRALCVLKVEYGAPKVREANELGLRLPPVVIDPGCTGTLKTARLDWGGGQRAEYTQRELDVLYMIYRDALSPLLRHDDAVLAK